MQSIKRFFRILTIFRTCIKYNLDNLLWSQKVSLPFKILYLFFPWRWGRAHPIPSGQEIREAMESLGPIFVKFGQLLSTRRDLLSDEIADELALLQDKVPPFDSKLAIESIEKSLGSTVKQAFAEFESTPLASASIAQVHSAKLHSGQDVVVKVLRPNIKKYIKRDIAVLEIFASMVEQFIPNSKRFHPKAVIAEIRSTLLDELDLLREAANASQLKRNFANSNHNMYVPEVYWSLCRENILVTERMYGIPIAQVKRLKENKVNMKILAEQGVEIFFTQVFRDCFFHADMHPGNIFVDATNPEAPKYCAVDFGIMGSLGPDDQHYLAANFLAFFKRDYNKVAQLHIESGWIPANTRIDAFESAIRTVCEPIFEKPLKDISFAQTLVRLFQTARRFNMEVQPQLLLLQKTMLSVEGLGRQLYPDLDLWNTAKPFLEKWMKQQVGFRAFFKGVKDRAPIWASKFPEIPDAAFDMLQHINQRALQEKTDKIIQTNTSNDFNSHAKLGVTLIVLAGIFAILHPLEGVENWLLGSIGASFGAGLTLLLTTPKKDKNV
jgi:ubiquinone biosynthesis protein